MYHIIIYHANALKACICCTDLREFSCNNTFDTC